MTTERDVGLWCLAGRLAVEGCHFGQVLVASSGMVEFLTVLGKSRRRNLLLVLSLRHCLQVLMISLQSGCLHFLLLARHSLLSRLKFLLF